MFLEGNLKVELIPDCFSVNYRQIRGCSSSGHHGFVAQSERVGQREGGQRKDPSKRYGAVSAACWFSKLGRGFGGGWQVCTLKPNRLKIFKKLNSSNKKETVNSWNLSPVMFQNVVFFPQLFLEACL